MCVSVHVCVGGCVLGSGLKEMYTFYMKFFFALNFLLKIPITFVIRKNL